MSELLMAGTVPPWTMGDRLRKAREAAGLEVSELADELGVSRNTITNYERGHVNARRPVLIAWSLRTGVPLPWVETGEWAPRGSNPQPAD